MSRFVVWKDYLLHGVRYTSTDSYGTWCGQRVARGQSLVGSVGSRIVLDTRPERQGEPTCLACLSAVAE